MRWIRKSDTSEMYCAVHNYQCDLHGHNDDPMVLDVAPHLHPGAWICPEAVNEIAQFEHEAEEKMDENEHSSAGLELIEEDEEKLCELIELSEFSSTRDKVHGIIQERGAEALTLSQIDVCTHALDEVTHDENINDELRGKADELYVVLAEHWEEKVNE